MRQPSFRKPDNFKSIQDEITRLALEKRKTPVIIIDEANYVSNAVLNDLKILFNFEMDSKDRAVILLVGLPQLNSTMRLGVHEPLRQRIIMNYNMEGLSKDEGRMYISEKIKGAGGNPDIFEENAVEAVLNADAVMQSVTANLAKNVSDHLCFNLTETSPFNLPDNKMAET